MQINLMGCLWLFTANAEGISGTNWLMSVGAHASCPLSCCSETGSSHMLT